MPLDLLKPKAVAQRLGYADTKAFLQMARRKGLREIRLNARVIRFDPAAVDRWLEKRAA